MVLGPTIGLTRRLPRRGWIDLMECPRGLGGKAGLVRHGLEYRSFRFVPIGGMDRLGIQIDWLQRQLLGQIDTS